MQCLKELKDKKLAEELKNKLEILETKCTINKNASHKNDNKITEVEDKMEALYNEM